MKWMTFRGWSICVWMIVAVVGLIVGVIVSGAIPFTASSGHLPITAWGLEFAMERSVTTQSLAIEAPPLHDRALIQRGAGHYEVGCAWCHGSPTRELSRITMHMTPHPPGLAEEVEKWSDGQLFYIVRHGVKFTGMPAWPDQRRPDEAWAVVAFLKTYPQLDEQKYRQLAGLDEIARARADGLSSTKAIPQVVISNCVSCHGIDGDGLGAYPKLAGQSRQYLDESLRAYRSAARYSGIMGPIAQQLSDADLNDASEYYATLSKRDSDERIGPVAAHENLIARGRSIAEKGLIEQKVGACQSCHGPSSTEARPEYPRLAGQRADYLVQQLHLLHNKKRGGTDRVSIMEEMAEMLSDIQIQAVSAYYASLSSGNFLSDDPTKNLRTKD